MDTKDSDRELLEWAAKAVGLDVHWGTAWQSDTMFRSLPRPNSPLVSNVEWNPLDDDGDALRLAVIVRAVIEPKEFGVEAWVFENRVSSGIVNYGDDPYAATRRAIVRAAAEIGRSMT